MEAPAKSATILDLLAEDKLDAAVAELHTTYLVRPGLTTNRFALDIHAVTVSLLKAGNLVKAYDLLERYPCETLESAVNFATIAVQLRKSDDELYAARLRVLRMAGTHPEIAKLTVYALFATAGSRKDWATAAACGRMLEQWYSRDSVFLTQLAEALIELQRYAEAIPLLHTVIRVLPEAQNIPLLGVTYARLAGSYKDVGDCHQALAAQRECVRLSTSTSMQSNLIMMMQYADGYGMPSFYAECERLEELCRGVPRTLHPRTRYSRTVATEGLKIGFVSGDFCNHSLTNLLLPIFKQLKLAAPHHTYHGFYTRPSTLADDSTAVYAAALSSFHFLNSPDAEGVCNAVTKAEIDILIDLSGHTANNALPAFIRSPAPVQVAWVAGMMSPSGIDAIPYFITDLGFLPAGFRVPEEVVTIPSAYCYTPIANSPSVRSELPLTRNGYVTFGSFNNPCKINARVLHVWSQILVQLPDSRLMCKTYSHDHAQLIYQTMYAAGVARERVECVTAHYPRTEDLMAVYTNSIDIALDTWPCAGMLTTLEALWMGCPVPTLRGNTFLHNQSVSVLCQLELTDLVADSESDYIKLVVALAQDVPRLQRLRAELRDLIKEAPLYKPAQIAKSLTEALESIWLRACDRVDTFFAEG